MVSPIIIKKVTTKSETVVEETVHIYGWAVALFALTLLIAIWKWLL